MLKFFSLIPVGIFKEKENLLDEKQYITLHKRNIVVYVISLMYAEIVQYKYVTKLFVEVNTIEFKY